MNYLFILTIVSTLTWMQIKSDNEVVNSTPDIPVMAVTEDPNAEQKVNGCLVDNRTIAVGESFTRSGQCIGYKCINQGYVVGVGCGQFLPRPGCGRSEYDLSKEYPQCCPHEDCTIEIPTTPLPATPAVPTTALPTT